MNHRGVRPSVMLPLTLPCLVTICLGVLSIVLGVCLKWAILPPVVDSMVMSQLRWQNIVNISSAALSTKPVSRLEESNTDTWEAWVTPPVTPYMKFNFFEIQVQSSLCPWCYITKIEFAKLFSSSCRVLMIKGILNQNIIFVAATQRRVAVCISPQKLQIQNLFV